MKPRRWILALLLIPAILLMGFLAAWRGLGLEDRLRRQILELLSRQGFEEVELAAVRPVWFGLDLRGLGFTRPGGGLRFASSQVRLRLSPLDGLFRPGGVLAAVDWIELRDFQLVADASLFHRAKDRQAPPTLEAWLRRLGPSLATLPEIRLRGGSLVWLERPDQPARLLDGLEGMVLPVAGRLEVLLRSRLLGGRHPALRAELALDPLALDGGFQLEVDSLAGRFDPSSVWEGLTDLQGWGRMTLGGRLAEGRLDSLSGAGSVWARLALRDLPDPLELAVRLELGLDSLRLVDGRLERRKGRLDFAAALPWKLEGARGRLRARGLDLATQVGDLPAGDGRWRGRLAGRLDLGAEARWEKGARVRLEARLEDLALDGRAWGDAALRADWRPGTTELRELAWTPLEGVKLTAQGKLEGLPGPPACRLAGRLDAELAAFPGLAGVLPAKTGVGLDFTLAGDRQPPGWRLRELEVSGGLSREGEPVLGLAGACTPGQPLDGPPEGALGLTLPDGRTLGALRLVDGAARAWELELSGSALDLARLLDTPVAPALRDLHGEMRVQGSGSQTQARGEFSLGGRRALLDGRLQWADSLRELNADLVLEGWRESRVEGRVVAALSGRRLELRALELGGLRASGFADFAARRYLAELEGDNLPVQTYWDLFVEDPAPFPLGTISLDAAGEGRLDEPGMRGGLEWRQRLLGRQARLRADLGVGGGDARIERGRLNVDGVDWAGLELEWAMADGPRRLAMTLLDHDLSELERPGTSSRLSGRLGGSLSADLRRPGGGLSGRLHVEAPRWGGLQFDRLDLGLSPGEQPGNLVLDSLALVAGGTHPLELRASGLVPMGAGELDLEIVADGDFLHPLSLNREGKRSRFFHTATGQGHLALQLGGTPLDPQLRAGTAVLQAGRLEMESVFKSVRGIEVDLAVQNGRLDIRRFEGRVGDGLVRLGNIWEAEGPDGPLEPWVLERPALEIGILTVETLDRKGQPGFVETTIPGLMEPDWSAAVRLSGSRGEQPCCLAGPADRPVLSGRALVDQAQFTYPFLKGAGPRTSMLEAVLSFFNRMEWDLALEAGRHVNYYRKLQGFDDTRYVDRFTGFLDRITVDIYADPTSKPLKFSGQIEDESFRVLGDVTSSRGSVVFLDKEFDVEEAGLSFDASTLMPTVWGRAEHTVVSSETDPGLQGLFGEDARQIWLQFRTDDELGNRQLRGRWDEVRIELIDDLNSSQDLLERGQEELLTEMGLDPSAAGSTIESMLPDVVAGFWEIPLRPIESRLRRQLGLDEVRIFLPVLRNTVEELLATQTRQDRVSQSYLDYLQGTRVTLGKSLSDRLFASWTGQLVASSPVEGETLVRLFQRCNLDYEVSRNLNLTGELVFDPLRAEGALKGDPRILLRYRQSY